MPVIRRCLAVVAAASILGAPRRAGARVLRDVVREGARLKRQMRLVQSRAGSACATVARRSRRLQAMVRDRLLCRRQVSATAFDGTPKMFASRSTARVRGPIGDAVDIDPGEHVLRFEAVTATIEVPITIVPGQKDRAVSALSEPQRSRPSSTATVAIACLRRPAFPARLRPRHDRRRRLHGRGARHQGQVERSDLRSRAVLQEGRRELDRDGVVRGRNRGRRRSRPRRRGILCSRRVEAASGRAMEIHIARRRRAHRPL